MGCRFAEWVALRGRAPWPSPLLVVAFRQALLAAASLDAMMITDSRYATQRWVRANAARDVDRADRPGSTAGARRISAVAGTDILESLKDFDFDYVIVNVK